MTTLTAEDRRERLKAIREERIPELERRDEELKGKIADALENGAGVEALKEDRQQTLEDLESYRAAADVLQQRIEDAERERLKQRARERLRSVQKKIGGLCGEAPRRAAEARELAGKLAKRLDWLAHARFRRQLLKKEAETLAARFELEVPELKRLEENPMEAVVAVKRKLRRISAPRDSLAVRLDAEKATGLLRRMFDEKSPTLELLRALDALEEAARAEPERQEKAS